MPSDIELERQVVVELAPLVDLNINVRVSKGIVYISGIVDSQAEKREAERLVSRVAGIKRIVNQLDFDPTGLGSVLHTERLPEDDVMDELRTEGIDLREQNDAEPDFTGGVGTTDVTQLEDEEPTFFPPTDPVVHNADRDHQGMEVRDGWAASSLSTPRYSDNDPTRFAHSDYELLDEVVQALRNDAATQDLEVRVFVRNSIVHLHGTVPSLEDADNAEAVAASVEGVLEVIEALEIEEPYIH